MNLTASQLTAALKGTSSLKAGRHSDGRNLYLSVSGTGSMSWVFMWDQNGKRREMGLGSFTGAGKAFRLGLAEARLAADKVRAQLAAGIDPLADRVAKKTAATPLFSTILEQVIVAKSADWKGPKNEQTWRQSFRDYGSALLGMPVNQIDADAVKRVLEASGEWGTKKLENLRGRIETVLDAAKAHRKGMDNAATWEGNLEHMSMAARYSKSAAVGHKEMAYEAVPAFVTELRAIDDNKAKGLLFVVLNANRSNEVREMVWSEVDLDTGLWTIPADRMKADKEHVVTLSRQSLDILRSIPRVEGNPFVFTGRDAGKPVSSSAFLDTLQKDMGVDATVHGFRTTFTDWSGDEGYSTEIAEMATAHSVKGIRKNYRRRTGLKLRTTLMQDWADYCYGVSNVVALKVAA